MKPLRAGAALAVVTYCLSCAGVTVKGPGEWEITGPDAHTITVMGLEDSKNKVENYLMGLPSVEPRPTEEAVDFREAKLGEILAHKVSVDSARGATSTPAIPGGGMPKP